LLDASAKERLGGGQTTHFLGEDVHEVDRCVGPAVGQAGFEVIPHAFVGVQFRGVRGERFQVQPGGAAEQLLHRVAAMNPAIVEQDDEVAGDLAQQLAEERCHLLALDIVFVQLAVQRAMTTLRADGDARDGRDPVVRIPMPHDRGLAHRAPGLPDRRDQEEARLVDEDEVGAQPCGVFFTRGQPERFHAAMAASSRSRARRSGFWWLQPNWCKSLPTWLRW
jgi:hypothetical protein